MIITIDGPAGAGKSTVAKRLAERLNFAYLDTGSMYRAVALAGLREGVDWDDPPALVTLAETLSIRIENRRTYLNDEDVTDAVRSLEVTRVTRYSADNPCVRELMVDLQRAFAQGKDIVTEGRDQGSAVFPDAEHRIFLTATPEERARRRRNELLERGEDRSVEDLQREIIARDDRDAAREVGPLVEPDGATRVVTDGMSIDEVVEHLAELVGK